MEVKTRLFQVYPQCDMGQLAISIHTSLSQVYRVRQGKRKVSASFIAGVLTTFPGHRFEDLFYIERRKNAF